MVHTIIVIYVQSYFRIASSNTSISTSRGTTSPNESSASEFGGKSSSSPPPGFGQGESVEVGGVAFEEEDRFDEMLLPDDKELVEGVDGGCELDSSGGLNDFCFIGSPVFD